MYQIICVAGKNAGKAHRYAVGNYPRDNKTAQNNIHKWLVCALYGVQTGFLLSFDVRRVKSEVQI